MEQPSKHIEILVQGCLESVYQKCLEKKFELRGLKFIYELKIPIEYKGLALEADLRLDFLPVKIKAV